MTLPVINIGISSHDFGPAFPPGSKWSECRICGLWKGFFDVSDNEDIILLVLHGDPRIENCWYTTSRTDPELDDCEYVVALRVLEQ